MSIELAEESSIDSAEFDDRYLQYRAVCTLAVVSLGCGLLSALAFLDWSGGAVGLVGLILGLVAIRQIRSRPHELTGLPLAYIGVTLSVLLLGGGWGWLGYVYATEVPEGYQRISYRQLQPDLENPSNPMARVEELDGKKVFIKGYMYPTDNQYPTRFLLCRDNGDCCFGGTPSLYDMIWVTMKDEQPLPFTTWQVKLAGEFRFAPAEGAAGQVIYQLEADQLP